MHSGHIIKELYDQMMILYDSYFTEWKRSPWKQVLQVPLFGEHSKRTDSLLPKSQSNLDEILESSHHSKQAEDLSLAIAKEIAVQKRTVEWIRENGVCMDNIKNETSLNPNAGKGAFAQPSLKKGEVIVPAPMLHINDEDALRMPAFEGEKKQLLLNYCFGHIDSSLLLCPYTNALLLNHCSERRSDLHHCRHGKRPNATYRWSKCWDTQTGCHLVEEGP